MATVSDLNQVPLAGLNYIDALLDTGPSWNYLTNASQNTLYYTFSVGAGTEPGKTGQVAFSTSQQSWTTVAIAKLQQITGINFVMTTNGNVAQIHFANMDLPDSSVTGLCSWNSSYGYNVQTNQVTSYSANAWIYLDNNEWYAQNSNLTPGGYGFETLLHELGHAMGLKHPFEGSITLPVAQDNTANTLMSYNYAGGAHQDYSQYDIAALNWLYGGDGLEGSYGVNSVNGGRYVTGTNGNDIIDGNAGNELIDGAGGINTVVFSGPRSSYILTTLANGTLQVTGGGLNGSDILSNIQYLTFSDGSVQAQLAVDTTPPVPPTVTVNKLPNGYVNGSTPIFSGTAEAGSTVKLYIGPTMIGSTTASSSGAWNIIPSPLKDGMDYALFATATDAAGNVSANSNTVTFNVDTTPPDAPGLAVATNGSGYVAGAAPVVTGSAEVGSTVKLYIGSTVVGSTVVDATGTWSITSSPLADASNYALFATATDAAGNVSANSSTVKFSVDTVAPAAPSLSVTKNANGYVPGATPIVTGTAEAGSTVKLYIGTDVVGSAVVDNTGVWSIPTTTLKNGSGYALYATATDAAGNISAHSPTVTFNVDATPPTIPTGALSMDAGSNMVSYSGTGEIGTIIDLVNINNATEVGRTTVGADGKWHIGPTVMPNGSYSVSVVSLDAADNATSSSARINFTINSPFNMTGDAGNNTFTATANNSGIDGGGGMDTVIYGGPRANFTISKQPLGYSVVDNTGALGQDTLVNIERLKFSDGTAVALDIDGSAGQVYRMYQAAFDRTPDAGGFAYWLNAMDNGLTLSQVSSLVLQSKEAVDIYMADPSDSYFVTQLYHHVLHREPDAAGLTFWLNNVHSASRADVMVMFSESPENQAQVIGTIQNGIEYTPWTHT